jgi:hypothetical protein
VKFILTMEVEINDADADLIALLPRVFEDRFNGSVYRFTSINVTGQEPEKEPGQQGGYAPLPAAITFKKGRET